MVASHMISYRINLPALLPGGIAEGEAERAAVVLKVGRGVTV